MNVLVTGATGFIGRHVLDELLKCGHSCIALARNKPEDLPKGVAFLKGDIANSVTVKGKLDDVECVVHLAGREDIFMERGDAHGDRMFEVNVLGTKNLLENVNKKCVQRVVVITSCAANGYFGDGRAAKETDIFNLTHFESAYIWSRYQTENLCLEYASEGLPVVVVEPTFIIGPGDSRPNFPGRMILEFLQGKTKIIPRGGSNWISVYDVTRGIVHLLEKKPRYVRYLFADENMSYEDFYKIVAQETGMPKPKLKFPRGVSGAVGSLADGLFSVYGVQTGIPVKKMARIAQEYFYFDGSRAKKEGCYKGGNVRSAIREAIDWFRLHKKR